MDRAQELLELGRADDPHPLAVILALDDPEQAVATDAEVGPLVPRAADLLDLVAERFKNLGDELLEPFGGQVRELRELQVGPFRLAAEPFRPLLGVTDLVADRLKIALDLREFRAFEPPAVALDLEQGVFDRVVQPGPLGACELVLIPPENGVMQVLERSGQLAGRADRRRVVLVRGGGPENPLPGRRRGRQPGCLLSQPLQHHCCALRSQTLHSSELLNSMVLAIILRRERGSVTGNSRILSTNSSFPLASEGRKRIHRLGPPGARPRPSISGPSFQSEARPAFTY